MKSLVNIISFLIPLFFFSQNQKPDTVYIQYDNIKDKHVQKKNEINYFDICVDNKKYVQFQYGISMTKTKKTFNENFISRKELSRVIKNDNANKSIIFIIVKQLKNNTYQLYESDHIVRVIRD